MADAKVIKGRLVSIVSYSRLSPPWLWNRWIVYSTAPHPWLGPVLGWGWSYCATILEFSFVRRGRCPAGGGAALARGYHGHHRHHHQPRHAACCSMLSSVRIPKLQVVEGGLPLLEGCHLNTCTYVRAMSSLSWQALDVVFYVLYHGSSD